MLITIVIRIYSNDKVIISTVVLMVILLIIIIMITRKRLRIVLPSKTVYFDLYSYDYLALSYYTVTNTFHNFFKTDKTNKL